VGAVREVRDKRSGTTVDLVLGKAYRQLRSPQEAAAALTPKPSAPASPGGAC
jgi:hypothetical protein